MHDSLYCPDCPPPAEVADNEGIRIAKCIAVGFSQRIADKPKPTLDFSPITIELLRSSPRLFGCFASSQVTWLVMTSPHSTSLLLAFVLDKGIEKAD
ncbi:MAG: hypothetical protein WC121_05185 [Candidatus Kapaibacterium sp.]